MREYKKVLICPLVREAFKDQMHKHLAKRGLNTTEVKKISNAEFIRLTGLPNSYDYLALAYNNKGNDPSSTAFIAACEVIGLKVLPMETITKPFRLSQ